MQLNKVLKTLLLALPVLAVAACSSKKSANDDQSWIGAGTGIENCSSNLSSEEQARLQMQELQKENTIYFGLDKYDVSNDFAQMLDSHATFLRNKASYKVTIEGHADEYGTPEYNIALGERRANSVKIYLQGKGVLADQISIVSYGKEKPAVLGHDAEAYAKNRRAVLVY
ncbi:MAG: peptidoglycan-associated lipoprotein Pal [Serratia symbiotica]|nr:peptidoglycan-associated lipoprotein Pal [Serratia symbiotica]